MKPVWIDGTWSQFDSRLRPRIVSAMYYQRQPLPPQKFVHSMWVLDYSRSGAGLVRVGHARSPWMDRAGGFAHLYKPGTAYWEDASSVRGLEKGAYVIFTGGNEAGLDRLLDKRGFARFADPSGLLDGPLQRTALAGRLPRQEGLWRAQAGLAEILAILFTAVPEDGQWLLTHEKSGGSPEKKLLAALEDFFRSRLAEKVSLADAARHLHISPSSLSHRCVKLTGRTPMTMLTDLRLELARSLLLRGLKLADVATQTGFCDAFHLSKTFKIHCGVSPRRFRDQKRL